jgi:hypothetical protein
MEKKTFEQFYEDHDEELWEDFGEVSQSDKWTDEWYSYCEKRYEENYEMYETELSPVQGEPVS